MLNWVENKGLMPVVFIPLLVMDSDHQVVSTGAIDFVCCSGYSEGELYAIKELRPLFLKKTISERGLVFGALVAIGDPELTPFLDEIRPHLTREEIQVAARVHTQFPQHQGIQYWLRWAKELVGDKSKEGELGSSASALALVVSRARVKEVCDSKRHFPMPGNPKPLTVYRKWTLDEYAEVLAKDLYELEEKESPPRVFSEVLRSWGLEPQAPIVEQYIAPARSQVDDKPLRNLSGRRTEGSADADSAKGFFRRLFGNK
jgi:hypothetical protein